MLLTNEHLSCYIFFIICIVLITYFYLNFNKNESFYAIPVANPNQIPLFNDSEITNVSTKNSVNKQLKTINTLFNKYTILDPAININNNGVMCDNINYNNCKPIDNSKSSFPQCITNNIMTSCSKFFTDGYINSQTNINISSLTQNIRDNIIRNSRGLILNLDKQNKELSFILDTLIDKFKLSEQQLSFIKYNKGNINDKTKLVKKSTEEYEKNENDININQVNFSNFLSKNNNNTTKISFYYNIIIGLIVTLVIIGIFNIFVSDMTPEQ